MKTFAQYSVLAVLVVSFIGMPARITGASSQGTIQQRKDSQSSDDHDAATSIMVKLEYERAEPDRRGTDVTNIYKFTVSQQENDAPLSSTVWVLYHLDNRLIKAYENVALPFSFERNLKAQRHGDHVVRVVIEDLNDIIIGSASVVVHVTREGDKSRSGNNEED